MTDKADPHTEHAPSGGEAEETGEHHQSDGLSLDEALARRYDELNVEPQPEPLRDEHGRFKSANAEAGNAEEAEAEGKDAADEESGAEGEEAGEGEEEEAEGIEPPAHLPQPLKDAWKDMPAAAREAMARHQADIDRKFSQQGRTLQTLQPISERLNKAIESYPALRDMTPEQIADAAVSLVPVQRDLEQDPANTVLRIAQEFGVLEQIKAHLSGQKPSDQSNHIGELQREIRSLKQQLEQSTDSVDEKISAAMSERETASAVESFASKAEHWADVEPHLPHFIDMVREQQPDAAPAETLQAAYDMAVHAIPEVRAKVQGSEKPPAKPDPERARKAKRASSTNVRSTQTGKGREKTLDETLSETFDALQAG